MRLAASNYILRQSIPFKGAIPQRTLLPESLGSARVHVLGWLSKLGLGDADGVARGDWAAMILKPQGN